MLLRKRQPTSDEHLDRIGKRVVTRGGISKEEADTISTSPFMYARLRARIEAEQARRAGPQSGWLATLFVARRAMPALVL
jgi:hypothetical protein